MADQNTTKAIPFMENPDNQSSPANDQNIHEFFRKLLADRDVKIAQLIAELNAVRSQSSNLSREKPSESSAEMAALLGGLRAENEQLQTRFSKEKSDIIQQLARQDDELKKLREENQIFRNAGVAPKQARIGFGWLGWLVFAGLVGLAAFFYSKLKYQKVAPVTAVFENYRDKRLFQFEYDINQGQFGKIEATLDKDLADKNFESIKPEIEFLRKTIRASGRFLSENGKNEKVTTYVDLAEKPNAQPELAPEKPGKKKTLTINYDVPVTLRHEATTTSEAIKKLQKETVLTVIDRTFTRDKVRTIIDGNKYELRDYWYKVETKEGETGWVFGFFTSKSQEIKYLLDSAGEPVIPEKAPQTKPVTPQPTVETPVPQN